MSRSGKEIWDEVTCPQGANACDFSVPLRDLWFADFDDDGKTDVFRVDEAAGEWWMSYEASGEWEAVTCPQGNVCDFGFPLDEFESWSQICLEALFGATI